MAQPVMESAPLPQDPSSIPSTVIKCLSHIEFLWPLRAPLHLWYVYMCMNATVQVREHMKDLAGSFHYVALGIRLRSWAPSVYYTLRAINCNKLSKPSASWLSAKLCCGSGF